MTRTIAASVASFVLASAMVAAQAPMPSQQPQSDAPRQTPAQPAASSQASGDISMSGCLVPGSAAGTFVLANARATTSTTSSPGQRYVVMATGADVDLAENVNKTVTISGTPSAAAPARPSASAPSSSTPATPSSSPSGSSSAGASAAMNDSNLPRFSAKSIVSVGANCTASAPASPAAPAR